MNHLWIISDKSSSLLYEGNEKYYFGTYDGAYNSTPLLGSFRLAKPLLMKEDTMKFNDAVKKHIKVLDGIQKKMKAKDDSSQQVLFLER